MEGILRIIGCNPVIQLHVFNRDDVIISGTLPLVKGKSLLIKDDFGVHMSRTQCKDVECILGQLTGLISLLAELAVAQRGTLH